MRKANAKKGMFASTHLVVRGPDGSKYEAAKKWKLPAVTVAWLLQSARTGQRADESKFLVEDAEAEGWFLANLGMSLCRCAVHHKEGRSEELWGFS